MNHQIGTFCRNIDSKMTVSGKALIEDVRPLVGNFSLDIICQTAMGVQVNAQVDDLRRQELAVSGKVLKPTAQSEFVNSTIDFIDVASQRLVRPWLHAHFLYRFSFLGLKMRQIVERMNQFNFSVIDKQITAMKGQTERPEEGSRRMSGRRSFLDQLLMLKGESKMNLEEVQEEVNTFMGAGSDTTSTTLQLALLLLGLNVDKQVINYRLVCKVTPGRWNLSSGTLLYKPFIFHFFTTPQHRNWHRKKWIASWALPFVT